MPKIEKFDLKFHDFFGTPCGTRPAYRVTDDQDNQVIFCIDEILESIKDFESSMTDDIITDCMNVKPAEFHNRIKDMRNFVANLSEENMIKITECLPHLKNGNIRSTTLPIYMTGMTEYEGEQGAWCRVTSIEVAATPWVIQPLLTADPRSIFAPSTKVNKVFSVDFCRSREYNKKDTPVVDKDGNYNLIEYERNSYLKADTLVPGRIYMDAKDREFLFLGNMQFGYQALKPDGTAKRGQRDTNSSFYYTFLQLNDKRKREIETATSFEEWWRPYFQKAIDKHAKNTDWVPYYEGQLLKMAESFKVVAEAGVGFTPEQMKCRIEYIVKGHDWDDTTRQKYEADFKMYFEVFNIGVKYYYVIEEAVNCKIGDYEYTDYALVYKGATLDAVEKELKAFKASHPDKKYRKRALPIPANKKVTEGPATNKDYIKFE